MSRPRCPGCGRKINTARTITKESRPALDTAIDNLDETLKRTDRSIKRLEEEIDDK